MTTGLNAADLDHFEMADALITRARLSGSLYEQAAMHLLAFTELPGTPRFAAHVHVAEETDENGATVLAAEVRNWPDLLADTSIYLTGGSERLLKLAASGSFSHRGLPRRCSSMPRYATGPGGASTGSACSAKASCTVGQDRPVIDAA